MNGDLKVWLIALVPPGICAIAIFAIYLTV
jgi:hypothetical protein